MSHACLIYQIPFLNLICKQKIEDLGKNSTSFLLV